MSFAIAIDEKQQHPVVLLQDNETGASAEIYTYGGLLNAFHITLNGSKLNLVDGFVNDEDAKHHIRQWFNSAKLAPFVCRMNHGQYNHAGTAYRVNKFYLQQHAIHGLIYDLVFTITDSGADDAGTYVLLTASYKGEDSGYPFSFDISVKWTLRKAYQLSVTTTITNTHDAVIPLADGWHPYFVMDVPADECTLQFDSSSQVEFDETLLPTGKLLTYPAFMEAKSLKDVQIDNCFVLDSLIDHPRCVLTGKELQLIIQADKSYPYLQVFIPPQRKSIAIENLSGAPDCFNNGMGLVLLPPQQSFTGTTTYTWKST